MGTSCIIRPQHLLLGLRHTSMDRSIDAHTPICEAKAVLIKVVVHAH